MIEDQIITAAAAEVHDALLASVPSIVPKHQFTSKFERKMKRLLFRERYRLLYNVEQYIVRFALVAIISMAILLSISPAARAKIVTWIKEQYASFMEYHIPESKPEKTRETVPKIRELPDGYGIVSETVTENIYRITLENIQKEQVHIIAAFGEKSADIFVKNSDAIYTETKVKDCVADFYEYPNQSGSSVLIWNSNEFGYTFCLIAPMDKTEMIHLAELIS